MLPEVGVSKPASIRSRVLLPQPEGPSRAKNSFSRMLKLTSLTAMPWPKDLLTWFSTSTLGVLVCMLGLHLVEPLGGEQRGEADQHHQGRQGIDFRGDAEADHRIDLHRQR